MSNILVSEDSGPIECAIAESFTTLDASLTALDDGSIHEPAPKSEKPVLVESGGPQRIRLRLDYISGFLLLLSVVGVVAAIVFVHVGFKRGRITQQTSAISSFGDENPLLKDDSSLDYDDVVSTSSLNETSAAPSISPSSAAPSTSPSSTSLIDENEPITFYVMGDIPYDDEEKDTLRYQLEELDEDSKFIIHLGDITKAKDSNCAEEEIRAACDIFKQSPIPFKIIPGDNDWHRCPSRRDSWELWLHLFYRFEDRWEHDLPLIEQKDRKENFAFFYRGVLFIGVHVIGGMLINGDDDDGSSDDDYFDDDEYEFEEDNWYKRLEECATWTRENIGTYANSDELRAVMIFGHAERQANTYAYFDVLKDMIIELLPETMPVYYVHGDGHTWSWEEPYEDAPNFVDVMVDNGNDSPPLKMTLYGSDHPEVFKFDRQGGKYEDQ